MTKSKVGQDDSAEEKEKKSQRRLGWNGKSIELQLVRLQAKGGGAESGNEDP
jgi:hypothetical protein